MQLAFDVATFKPVLSSREEQVVKGVVRGLTRREIGAELGISPATVATYEQRAAAKLGVAVVAEGVTMMSRAVLVAQAFRCGIV